MWRLLLASKKKKNKFKFKFRPKGLDQEQEQKPSKDLSLARSRTTAIGRKLIALKMAKKTLFMSQTSKSAIIFKVQKELLRSRSMIKIPTQANASAALKFRAQPPPKTEQFMAKIPMNASKLTSTAQLSKLTVSKATLFLLKSRFLHKAPISLPRSTS